MSPNSHDPFVPRHLTASGHIEPGNSGLMRPGHETAYPFSTTPTTVVAGPSRQSLLT